MYVPNLKLVGMYYGDENGKPKDLDSHSKAIVISNFMISRLRLQKVLSRIMVMRLLWSHKNIMLCIQIYIDYGLYTA